METKRSTAPTAGPNKTKGLPAFSQELVIAGAALLAIAGHLLLRFAWRTEGDLLGLPWVELPLLLVLLFGGLPLVLRLSLHLIRRELRVDLLAGISIVVATLLGEYLAGTLVILMLSGGQVLEDYAVRRASSALLALAARLPASAHRKEKGSFREVPVEQIQPGDVLAIFPHETCPVDGTVLEGRSTMDESYLTGEPYLLSKTVGSAVLSGAVNGNGALTIRADSAAIDSRYAKIMQVMRDSEQRRPRLRRLGDQLGAWYTPLALTVAVAAWLVSGEPLRFLAVLVVATPCPLLIGIPVAILGSVSLAARRGIIIKDPTSLERVGTCRTAIFDKTGTLTHGRPELAEVLPAPGFSELEALAVLASLERYSRHPLAAATLTAARQTGIELHEVSEVGELPGEGLRGTIASQRALVTSRKKLAASFPEQATFLPPLAGGLECVLLLDDRYVATFRYRDEPRQDGRAFIEHLATAHGFERVLMVSGDRESEVRYLAGRVGIREVHADQSPEQKLNRVRAETARAPTVYVGDGINDAPALTAATVGIAFGRSNDVAAEAAGAVVLESSLRRVDELFHIGRRMRAIALQSAVGGMALSLIGMLFAAAGYLPPVMGAMAQEGIDVLAVAGALRASWAPKVLTDC